MENSEFLSKVLHIPFELQMPATLSGYLNDSLSQMRVNGSLPQFTYDGKYYESGTLLCENQPDALQCQLRASTLMKKVPCSTCRLLRRPRTTDSTQPCIGATTLPRLIVGKWMPSLFPSGQPPQGTPHPGRHPAQSGHSERHHLAHPSGYRRHCQRQYRDTQLPF